MTKIHCKQFCGVKQGLFFQTERLVYKENSPGEYTNNLRLEASDLTPKASEKKEIPRIIINGVPIEEIDEPLASPQKTKESAHKDEKPTSKPSENKASLSGEDFVNSLPPYGEDREQAIYKAATDPDNIPEEMREFKPVEVSTVGPDGVVHTGKIFVAPDYFKIKGVRVPMDPRTAKAIADHYGCLLPTPKMVDEIYLSADTKVDMAVYNNMAKRLGIAQIKGNQAPDGKYMTSKEFYLESSRITDERLQEAGYEVGKLVAGIKKDIVIIKRLQQKRGVAIYGGSKHNGRGTVQPLGIPHEDSYADYSHGFRMIKQEMEVDGKMVKVADVLKDPVLSKMISNEGPIDNYLDFYKTEGRFPKYPPQPNFFGIPGRPPERIDKAFRPSGNGIPIEAKPQVDENNAKTKEPEVTKDEETPQQQAPKEEEEIFEEEELESDEEETEEEEPGEETEEPETVIASAQSKSMPSRLPKSRPASFSQTAAPTFKPTTSYHQKTENQPAVPVEKPTEHIEKSPDGTMRIIGDSLSQGAIGEAAKLGINALPQYLGKKTTLGGQTTIHGERTIDQMSDAPKKGALLAIFLGTNDLFGNFSPNQIIATLQRIYEKARAKGYTVIGATIPPPCESVYTKYYGKYTDDQLEERWKTINDWILNEGPHVGLRKIIPFHTILADPDNPRRLHSAIRAKDGLHLKDYKPMAMEIGKAIDELSGTTQQEQPDQQQPDQQPQSQPQQSSEVPANPIPSESNPAAPHSLADFKEKEIFSEKTLTYFYPPESPAPLRIHINIPKDFDPDQAIITFFALPEGNTIEQTEGRKGGHWRNRIQQVGAQIRELRASNTTPSRAVVYIEGPPLPGTNSPSLINFLKTDRAQKGKVFADLMQDVKTKLGTTNATIDISGHSGGGSLKFAYLEHVDTIPDDIKRISFLDSNYGCRRPHVDKMTEWLQRSNDHFLTVSVYDDRQVQVKDPKTGEMKPLGASSFLRAQEMMEFFRQNGIDLKQVPARETPGYTKFTALDGRVNFVILENPGNKIRHSETVQLGGLTYAETAGTQYEKPFNTVNYQNFIEA